MPSAKDDRDRLPMEEARSLPFLACCAAAEFGLGAVRSVVVGGVSVGNLCAALGTPTGTSCRAGGRARSWPTCLTSSRPSSSVVVMLSRFLIVGRRCALARAGQRVRSTSRPTGALAYGHPTRVCGEAR